MQAFFKPATNDPVFTAPFTLASSRASAPGATRDLPFTLSPLSLTRDLTILHFWTSQPYTRRFWNLATTKKQLERLYHRLLKSPHAHSFMGFLGPEPVCQIDLYLVAHDELGQHVKAKPTDCGLHLLMAPPESHHRGLSPFALRSFIDYYFSHQEAGTLYAEPDRDNALANQLARKVGFRFEREVTMSYKTANLYRIKREEWRREGSGGGL